jgi:hypothetical protein
MKSLRDYRREAQAEARRVRTGRLPVVRSNKPRLGSAASYYESCLRNSGRGETFFFTIEKEAYYYVGQKVTAEGKPGTVTLVRSDRVLIEWD